MPYSTLFWSIYTKDRKSVVQGKSVQSRFLLTVGCLDIIQIFFDSRKVTISVFYLREHIELIYIIQKRVEKGIVYFFSQIIFRAILLLTLVCLDNIQIFFDSLKYRISVFYRREHIELVYKLQNRVEQGIVYFYERLYSE